MTRTMLLGVLPMLLAACATPVRDADGATATTTFIIVRHGEKVDASRDPDLSAAGRERARQLAQRLADSRLVGVYATAYKRTQQTASPAASAHALDVATYDASEPATAFASRLRAAHDHGTVLVAGHSNTVPDIVAALCTCTVAPMPDDEYDRLSIVRIDADGRTELIVERYGTPAP